MKKDLFLLLASVVITLILALGVIRWFAPGLLGMPADLHLVQLDDKLPAFFKGVFRDQHSTDNGILIKDPLTRVRARPFYPTSDFGGPHDVLGLRNTAVPVTADIVTIGDSMTYGNNAFLEHNWPSWMQSAMKSFGVNVYNMSTGGWAAVQYLDMMGYATAFQPDIVIVAFYTGNDPLESIQMVNGNKHWQWLKDEAGVEKGVTTTDLPEFSLDVPAEEQWSVRFADGFETVFTPHLRLISNVDHPAVDAGYAVMAQSAKLIAEQASQQDIQIVFTIIPTKELVYADKIRREALLIPDSYQKLVTAESGRIKALSTVLQSIEGARYVDVVTPLQNAALESVQLYLSSINGHPVAAGYQVIGETIAAAVADLPIGSQCGLRAYQEGDKFMLLMVNKKGFRVFRSERMIEQNGWLAGDVPMVSSKQLMRLPYLGTIDIVDPDQYGPASCNTD